MQILANSQLVLNTYTGTNFDDTPTSILGVDALGNVVKTDANGFITDVPTLQEVTDAGNNTIRNILFRDGSDARFYKPDDSSYTRVRNTTHYFNISSADNSVANALSIDNNANVGIGNTSPSAKLEVENIVESEIRVTESVSGDYISLYQQNGNSYLIAGNKSGTYSSDLITYAGGFERMRVTSTGAVGIGTSNPSYKLQIDGGAKATNNTTLLIRNAEADTLFRVKDGGNVGIGVVDPLAKLHVIGSGNTSGTTALLVENSDGTNLIRVYDSGETNWQYISTSCSYYFFDKSSFDVCTQNIRVT